MPNNSDMTRTDKPGCTSLRPLDQCFNWYWNSKTDHLWLYFRYYINLLYLLSCYCIVYCLFTYFTLSRWMYT